MMTIKQVLEYILVELNKVKAPNLQRSDFIYFWNKATYQVANRKAAVYDMGQQIDDDMAPLKIVDYQVALDLANGYYSGTLADDYYHPLNVQVVYELQQDYKCDEAGALHYEAANRLPSGAAKNVLGNYYFKPSYKKPYFYIYNNIIQIRSGSTSIYKPVYLLMDYLRKPTPVDITQEQIDDVIDDSQVLEFPDYMVYEIINDALALILENGGNPRIQTTIPLNQTIPTPGAQPR